jgi:AcrR family transcriptional regulator
MAAAESSFSANGYAGSRLVDITATAGLTTGALYRYWSGKDTLYQALFNRLDEALTEALSCGPDLRDVALRWIQACLDHHGTWRACFEICRRGNPTADRAALARERWISNLGPSLPNGMPLRARRIAAQLLIDLLTHRTYEQERGWLPRRSPEAVADALIALVGRGIYRPDTVPPDRAEERAPGRGSIPFEPYIRWEPAAGKAVPLSTRGRATWERIRAAAVRVFAERGLSETTMHAIGREARVSSGTVYRYFVDKEDLFRSLQASAEAALIEETRLPMQDGRLAVRDTALAYFDVYQRNVALMRVWQELRQVSPDMALAWQGMRRQAIEAARRVLRYGFRHKLVWDDLDLEMAAEMHSMAYEATAYSRLILGWDQQYQGAHVASLMGKLFLYGLQGS